MSVSEIPRSLLVGGYEIPRPSRRSGIIGRGLGRRGMRNCGVGRDRSNDPKDAWINVRFTRGEKNAVKAAAISEGRKAAPFIRSVVMAVVDGKKGPQREAGLPEAAIQVVTGLGKDDLAQLKQLTLQLQRAGTNLNQMVSVLNLIDAGHTEGVDAPDRAAVKRVLELLEDGVNEVIAFLREQPATDDKDKALKWVEERKAAMEKARKRNR